MAEPLVLTQGKIGYVFYLQTLKRLNFSIALCETQGKKRIIHPPPTPKWVDFFFKTSIIKKLEMAKLKWDWLKISKNEIADNVTYINFLLTKDVLIVPQLSRPEDEIAFNELSGFFLITQQMI